VLKGGGVEITEAMIWSMVLGVALGMALGVVGMAAVRKRGYLAGYEAALYDVATRLGANGILADAQRERRLVEMLAVRAEQRR